MIDESLIRKYEPRAEWFQLDSLLHGISHLARVFILQEIISERLLAEGRQFDHEAVRWASVTHDVGRVNDDADAGHGFRSAEWAKQNLGDRVAAETLECIAYLNEWHVPSDESVPRFSLELEILKDADGLDRVRLYDLDPNYLRLEVSRGMIDLAQQLLDKTLESRKYASAPFETVLRAAIHLGLVRPSARVAP